MMKRTVMFAALAATLVCGSALAAKPEGKPGQHPSPVTNPGPDIVINLNTPAAPNSNFHAPVSQVPEPEGLAMVAAGAAVVAVVALRRRRP